MKEVLKLLYEKLDALQGKDSVIWLLDDKCTDKDKYVLLGKIEMLSLLIRELEE